METTNVRGIARAQVGNARHAGTSWVRIGVASPRLLDSVMYTVVPGRPAQVRVGVLDSTAYVGRSYSIRARVRDRRGNLTAAQDSMTFAARGAVSVDESGNVRGERVGRGTVTVVRGPSRDSAMVSVPPKATLVALARGDTLVVVDLDASGLRTIPIRLGVFGNNDPVWLGGQIIVENRDSGRLYVIDTAGASPRRLTDADTIVRGERNPTLLPDGSVVFSGSSRSGTQLWRVDRIGGVPRRLPTNMPDIPNELEMPSASPDGALVAYRTLGIGLRILRLADGARFPLVGTGRPAFPGWSPLGDWVVFTDGDQLMRVRPDATGLSPVSTGRGYRPRVDWLPDGVWVIGEGATGLELVHVTNGDVLPLSWSTGLRSPAIRRAP